MGVTILFSNGAKTFIRPDNDGYLYDSLISKLEYTTSGKFNTLDGFDLIRLNQVKNLARNLFNRGYGVDS